MITVDELAEHGVVGVVDHFSDRRLIHRTEARALTTADDCLKAIFIRCRTETIPGTGSINKFSYSNRLENTARTLNRDEVMKVWRLGNCENFVGKR